MSDTPPAAEASRPSGLRTLRRRVLRLGLAAVVLVFLGLNALAFFHAWSLTHFTAGGKRTVKPEKLSATERAKVLLTGARIPRPSVKLTAEEVGRGCRTVGCSRDSGPKLEGWWLPAAGPEAPESSGTVLLFHGYAASRQTLVRQAREFAALGWDALLVDFRGSGGSAGNTTSVGYHEAEDVAAAVAELLPGEARERPVILYGISMGSAAILRAVGEFGIETDGLVLESPFAEMLGTVSNRFETMGVPSFPLAHLLTFWGGVQHGYWAFDHNPSEYARGVRVPVLLMAGERDPRARLAEVTRISENLAGEKELLVFPRAGHIPMLRADAGLWRREVADFLAARASGRSNTGP